MHDKEVFWTQLLIGLYFSTQIYHDFFEFLNFDWNGNNLFYSLI